MVFRELQEHQGYVQTQTSFVSRDRSHEEAWYNCLQVSAGGFCQHSRLSAKVAAMYLVLRCTRDKYSDIIIATIIELY